MSYLADYYYHTHLVTDLSVTETLLFNHLFLLVFFLAEELQYTLQEIDVQIHSEVMFLAVHAFWLFLCDALPRFFRFLSCPGLSSK